MSGLLTGGIATTVFKAAKKAGLALAATLTRETPGTRTPGNVTGGTNPTSTAYPCYGFVEDFGPGDIDGTLITVADRRVSLYGASLAVVPARNDIVAIDGGTYTLQHAQADPAKGLYVCVARGAG